MEIYERIPINKNKLPDFLKFPAAKNNSGLPDYSGPLATLLVIQKLQIFQATVPRSVSVDCGTCQIIELNCRQLFGKANTCIYGINSDGVSSFDLCYFTITVILFLSL